MLGQMYENGWGVDKNHSKAVEWYRKAAEQGHTEAKERLQYLSIKRSENHLKNR